mmetsp:Transcript_48856/g.147212  ORF Transcript_48856/g.147212 Transcript_48856/m.147212 type:complete len:91 (+) Transcript_48856:57-329(+)
MVHHPNIVTLHAATSQRAKKANQLVAATTQYFLVSLSLLTHLHPHSLLIFAEQLVPAKETIGLNEFSPYRQLSVASMPGKEISISSDVLQ